MRCVFRKKRNMFDPSNSLDVTDLNGNSLNEDLLYFTDKASANYERFVLSKQHNVKYVHDPVLINTNDANEMTSMSNKSIQDM